MESDKAAPSAVPTDSASVVMLRDAPTGSLEVLMIKRHNLSDVLGGAYVFPGGKVDSRDAMLLNRLDQPLPEMQRSLAEPQLSAIDAGILYVAAIRELFEEAGLLFGDAGLPPIEGSGGSSVRNRDFHSLLNPSDVRLASSRLTPWSRWVTPVATVMSGKRFDARFFVAVHQTTSPDPVHDQYEATECAWIEPRIALESYWEGRIQLAPPQIMSLVELARYQRAESVLTKARAQKPQLIFPEAIMEHGVRVLTFPGDDRHSNRARALWGPTRLYWRNNRYEPDGGIAALLT